MINLHVKKIHVDYNTAFSMSEFKLSQNNIWHDYCDFHARKLIVAMYGTIFKNVPSTLHSMYYHMISNIYNPISCRNNTLRLKC